tara:strand:- start:96 stop:371 length:276 start_codon:yes stop_codon:yes gene_type:complete
MSNTKYVAGIRFFPKKDGAPCTNGVITPNELFKQLKSGEVDKAKSEYKGETQYKISMWDNDDGSKSMTFNEYQPSQEQKSDQVVETDDLPF